MEEDPEIKKFLFYLDLKLEIEERVRTRSNSELAKRFFANGVSNGGEG